MGEFIVVALVLPVEKTRFHKLALVRVHSVAVSTMGRADMVVHQSCPVAEPIKSRLPTAFKSTTCILVVDVFGNRNLQEGILGKREGAELCGNHQAAKNPLVAFKA